MKKHKIIGIFLVLSVPIIMLISGITSFVFRSMDSVPSNQVVGVTSSGLALGERSEMDVAASIVRIGLSLLGILSLIFLTPLGIYFLVKKDYSMDQPQQSQPMQQPSVALDPTMAHKYQNLTPEQIKFIRGGSLSAFFGGLIWALGNKLWLWVLLGLIPFVNIYVWLKLTFHGRRMSWEKGDWQSFEQFKNRQKVVAWIVLAFAVLFILASVVPQS